MSGNNIDIAILGAGIAGLGAALKARELNRNYKIYEKNNSSGGLLDNFKIGEFLFDNAVHLSFANEDKVREIFDKTDFITHPAESQNFDNGTWIKHPVQNNLYPLPAEEKVELISSFIERKDYENVRNYDDWLRHQYGDLISERYPLPYTRKYWQHEAAELSTSWIGNRMRRASLTEVLLGSYSDEAPNTYYTKEMRYPVNGGFKSFIKDLIFASDISEDHEVKSINLKEKNIKFENGRTISYEKLVSSIPLPEIIRLCDSVPKEVIVSSNELAATSIDLVSIGFNKVVTDKLWFYIYDSDIFASRVYSPSVKSKNNAPKGCSSLQFEIYNPSQCSQYSKEELVQNTIYALKKMNIASESDIEFIHHKHLPWANVIFKHGMEENRKKVLDFLVDNEIISIGRFGEWDYLWSNQSFLSGYNIDI
ncbi:protoporphyrinogen/coproporphyrinogen oxidase [Vibrio nigripulchritudo]|uniref:protoporphyrinogen/coproporphyrinogen oxidase n=1 Tax=Vibrio nigripulchritudo TaxID=28173 RepID=UPI0005FA6E04|nr:NAD(P)-binding protein [Vibrio nigripulchritudo]KJY79067.1 O-antigen synthesis protein WbyH [Vibrio nigripulchritudo]